MSAGHAEAAVHGPDSSHPINRATATALFWVLCGAAAFALVAVPLAMVGAFGIVTVAPSTLVLSVILAWWARPHPLTIEAPPLATIVVLVGIALVSVLGVAFPTQHFTTNRDPGVYSSLGLWLSAEGELLIDGVPEVLRGIDGVAAAGNGFYDTRDDGKLYAQFSHMTGALLGTAHSLGGGAAMVRVNVAVGAAALVALYVAGVRVASAWPAAIAVLAVSWSLPQIYFTRGPYSEPITQLLLIGSLSVLLSTSALRPGHAALAGLLLGGVVGSRIDGVLVVVAAAALVIFLTMVREAQPGALTSSMVLAGSAIATTAIGVADLAFFSPEYLDHLWPEFVQAMLASVLVIALGSVLIAARGVRRSVADHARPHVRTLAHLAGVLTSGALAFLLVARPRLLPVRGQVIELVRGLQERQGLEVDGTRYYFEQSFVWFTWYLGWPLVITGVVGAGVAVWRVIARQDWRAGTLLILLGLPTLVYLWRPTITPDQVWAMRRFVPFGFPWITLSAALALTTLGRRLERSPRVVLVGGAVASIAAIGPAIMASSEYLDHREHRLTYGALDEMCSLIGDDLAIVDDRGNLGVNLVQPLAAGCGAPVARADLSDGALIDAARQKAVAAEMQLVLVTGRPETLEVDTAERGSVHLAFSEIERSVERPPRGLEPQPASDLVHVLTAE